ncbi:unnamed protein product [Litomosoides sigmodontis]|uniref:Uncharacterized protein n=1 Tax=Litomosoides sigmodontis TaxID=42156 RepID=A0A3P6SQ20_LITSI|nr:unnamed protein product [Litomosoides sigmodontis]
MGWWTGQTGKEVILAWLRLSLTSFQGQGSLFPSSDAGGRGRLDKERCAPNTNFALQVDSGELFMGDHRHRNIPSQTATCHHPSPALIPHQRIQNYRLLGWRNTSATLLFL